ncbi:uncharacterized protein RCO7_09294 [Rhynchosporium graminicola]|uniref:Uncharacterized protein n=1 Tax=Rhynchosporium graminicola TaxID=2792576 RepID=A0A1E1LR12_9HELO|nr:uncharacterized protein RCO7_09294 [Rhynchosporium commune]
MKNFVSVIILGLSAISVDAAAGRQYAGLNAYLGFAGGNDCPKATDKCCIGSGEERDSCLVGKSDSCKSPKVCKSQPGKGKQGICG